MTFGLGDGLKPVAEGCGENVEDVDLDISRCSFTYLARALPAPNQANDDCSHQDIAGTQSDMGRGGSGG